MKKISINTINNRSRSDVTEFIEESEKKYSRRINKAAEILSESHKDKPIILLSGPSGAGKTTSAKRIESLLDKQDIQTHTISMDNYFLPEHLTPDAVDENGKVDYESPYRMDIKLLNEHLMKIANCEPIEIPSFNFAKQEREPGYTFKRKPGELVLFEGIHALNPEVTNITDDIANCIYVSIRTRLELENGSLLHPSHIRLMRRMLRDKKYRGRGFEATMDMFDGVERGESLYIMPFKDRAKIQIDTFITYEASVYKPFLSDELHEVFNRNKDHKNHEQMQDFLDALDAIPAEEVPDYSLVREFIGGSIFEG
ncbi:MAG: nucleoside kinase [Ruminococcus sp.]|nr:nucleoside kinase [Ruminococcus sp.]